MAAYGATPLFRSVAAKVGRSACLTHLGRSLGVSRTAGVGQGPTLQSMEANGGYGSRERPTGPATNPEFRAFREPLSPSLRE